MSKKTKAGDDLQGLTRLVTDATIGVTELVEAVHHRVIHPPFVPSTPTQKMTSKAAGIIYKTIKWSTKFIGNGLDKALERLAPVLGEIKDSNEKKAIRSALNGVVGDYLEEKENPLKITMQLTYQGKRCFLDSKSLAEIPNVNGKLLLMVHGICMNDTQWTHKNHNHGEVLAKELDKTPLYLYYNSGRHISTNGQSFSELLEDLILNWSVPVEELVIVGHSMGGLVSRSALHYGQQQQKTWTKHLKKMVFLGTPHHGAPLERAGNYVDNILELISYAKPFARLGKIRSAGVTDLRYSNLVDEDWEGIDRFEMRKDSRQNIPLPEQVECYSIAASKGKETDFLLLGDGLVEVKSALGQHNNSDKQLYFKKENTSIFYDNTHFSLLSNPDVYAQIKDWLA